MLTSTRKALSFQALIIEHIWILLSRDLDGDGIHGRGAIAEKRECIRRLNHIESGGDMPASDSGDEENSGRAAGTIPAIDGNPFTDEDDFAGLRAVMRSGVELQSITLTLTKRADGDEQKEEPVVDPDEVLWHLVRRAVPDIATLYLEKSAAKDITLHSARLKSSVSTLDSAASKGYLPVVEMLIARGADVNSTRSNGITPLFMASQNGHVDVVNVLVEAGAATDKARIVGAPLVYGLTEGHVDVVRVLVEARADKDKARIRGHLCTWPHIRAMWKW